MNAPDRDFVDAARVVDESAVMRLATAVVSFAAAFVGRAFQARLMSALTGSPRTATQIAVLITSMCVTHAVLLQFLPARITPVRPLAYAMVLAFGALATAAGFITTRSSATATADSSAGTANTRKS